MELLRVENMSIEFHDKAEPDMVVNNFNMTIDEGEMVGLVGESGSGKSQSALSIAGLIRRHDVKRSGRILFQGKDLLAISRSELRKFQGCDIGIVFQEPMTSLNPVKKIGWQVEESLRIHTDMDENSRKERAFEVLRQVGLEDTERIYNAYPHELSGGQRQRVMIAAAIITRPKLLIADEPTTALDVTVQAQIIELLREINHESKIAILFISHDLNLVRSLCHRVIVMKQGDLIEEGDSSRIFEAPTEEYTKQLIAAIPRFEKRWGEHELTNNADNVLEVEDLSVRFKNSAGFFGRNSKEVDILTDVSFNVKRGEILGLVGESGSGKSTLARAILGVDARYTGTIKHGSKNPQMIFQDPFGSLNPSKKIGWILEEPLKNLTKLDRSQRNHRVVEMLKKVGLDERLISHYPRELSGGQRQRVCIALALIMEPEFLIADEAVSALDVTVQAQILELLVKLQRETGVSILFISHDLRVVYQICNRVLILNKGRIVEQGKVEDIYREPKDGYTKQLLRSAKFENAL